MKNYYKFRKEYKAIGIMSIIGVIALYIYLRTQGASHETSLFLMFLMLIYG